MKTINLASLLILNLFLFSTLAVAMHHEVKIGNKAGLGKYLTDTEGKTLYLFKNDSPGKSACTGPCVDRWPLFFREMVAAPGGVPAGDFGTITRDDGKKQTTFRGYPIYYWGGDAKAGDTKGQGMGNVWYVVNPDNFPPRAY